MSEQWMSIAEYARSYNLSDMTVRRRIKTGRLHAVLREGKYYIPAKGEMNKFPDAPPRVPHNFAQPIERSPHGASSYHQPMGEANFRPKVTERNLGPGAVSPFPSPSQPQEEQPSGSFIKFCEAALRNFDEAKKEVTLRYQAEIAALTAKVEQRDSEIAKLTQEVMDYKVLIEKINDYKSQKIPRAG